MYIADLLYIEIASTRIRALGLRHKIQVMPESHDVNKSHKRPGGGYPKYSDPWGPELAALLSLF